MMRVVSFILALILSTMMATTQVEDIRETKTGETFGIESMLPVIDQSQIPVVLQTPVPSETPSPLPNPTEAPAPTLKPEQPDIAVAPTATPEPAPVATPMPTPMPEPSVPAAVPNVQNNGLTTMPPTEHLEDPDVPGEENPDKQEECLVIELEDSLSSISDFIPVFKQAVTNEVAAVEVLWTQEEAYDRDTFLPLVRDAWQNFYQNYPEYSMYRRCYKFSISHAGQNMKLTMMFKSIDGSTADEALKGMELAKSAYAEVSAIEGWNDLTQYDKAHKIAEWVCSHMTYKYVTDKYGTVYHGLTYGEGSCAAYTGIYNLMLQQAGISCCGRYGYEKRENVAHVWTIATLDGTQYNIDVTACDGDIVFREAYFAKSDETFAKYYTW